MTWDVIGGLIRHLLTFGGGFLVTNGTIAEAELQTLVGAAVAIGGVLWSIFAKRAARPATPSK
jgi:hypothetical protein